LVVGPEAWFWSAQYKLDAKENLKSFLRNIHDDYMSCPLGLKGVVVAEGDAHEEVLPDVKSAIKFHIETFGNPTLARGNGREGLAANKRKYRMKN